MRRINCVEEESNINKFVTENDMDTKTSKVFFHTDENDENSLKIFSGSYHRELAKEIVSHLDIHLAKIRLQRYHDGEISV
jgi:hypothetical protein